ncbi:MAG: Rrf2 family transcriptional regulator [Dongiaceae bacterium]
MLSHRAKYALRALLLLAQETGDRPLLIADIAKRQKLPKKFLELILLDLKRSGMVRSFRGRHGGYVLARPADTIFFGQIIRLMDGPLAAIPCASLTAYRRCSDCPDEAACAIRRVFRQVRDATAAILDRTSLADVATKSKANMLASLGAGI